MSFLSLVQWLNETPLSIYLRESEVAFPVTEAVGTILWVDLRLMGLCMRRERVTDVVGRLEPWAKFGFVVMFISGLFLFIGKPANYYSTTAFRIKMALLPLAALNVVLFHKRVYVNAGQWDTEAVLPWQGRLVGLVSATLWVVIIVLGRWTAYFADELFQRPK